METDFIWESVLMVLVGFLLLRVTGRKSISQLTIPATVILISIGSIIVQPIIETSVVKTVISVAIFVLVLLIVEYLQVKSNRMEKFFTGGSVPVIKDGRPLLKNIKKVRLTVDKIEMHLRQNGIISMESVKRATIEPNGRLGYELTEDARPLTVGEFKRLLRESNESPPKEGNLFREAEEGKHLNPPPEKLD
ncbi:DUF421 domain-containing protein [Bacillus sp. FJAT-44742]|uniref:DUF421 domain-containing protein n=1 Tax=Bacillus sp. FJAT-44742 TaxID=2014005 RepID=UPI001E3DD919|nr:DUF421 domain-containing protein [Bacillus sp. FJAT-44742]